MITSYSAQRPLAVRAGQAQFASLMACGEYYVASQPALRTATPTRQSKPLSESYSQLPPKRRAKPTKHASTYSTSA